MAFNFSTERKPLTTFSLSGLADIVLLLLIFFLLTSSFIPQFGIQVNLPEADASASTQGQYVTVAITDKGQFFVEQRLVAKENLLDAVIQAKGEREVMVVRADRNATVEQLATVFNIGKAVNMRIAMATERGLLR